MPKTLAMFSALLATFLLAPLVSAQPVGQWAAIVRNGYVGDGLYQALLLIDTSNGVFRACSLGTNRKLCRSTDPIDQSATAVGRFMIMREELAVLTNGHSVSLWMLDSKTGLAYECKVEKIRGGAPDVGCAKHESS